MKEANIFAIHGFLGLPTDWNFFQWKQLIGVDWQAYTWTTLTDWAVQFNRSVLLSQKETSILMGYSFGGRLALHALLENPKQWMAAIIISTHPGLADLQERETRLQNDFKWAERFENENWSDLMHAWNGQEVFSSIDNIFLRKEVNYQRAVLSHALRQGSLGRQLDLREQISQLQIPILWITGQNDQRYSQLAQNIHFAHIHSKIVQIEQAGHRAPWSQPQIFSSLVQSFLAKINHF